MGLSNRRTGLLSVVLLGLVAWCGCGDDGDGPGPGDVTPPSVIVIPSLHGITAHSARVEWTTDESSRSTVFWAADTTLGWQDITDSTLVTEHSVSLTGLLAETVYYFAARSTDAAGNTSPRTETDSFETFGMTPTLILDPWETTVQVGDTLRLAVRVLNMTDLFGAAFDIDLLGGAAVFDADTLSAGPFLGAGVQVLSLYDAGAEVLEVAVTRTNPASGVDGDGTLAWVHLMADGAGTAGVNFHAGSIALRDPSGALVADFDQLVVVPSTITVQ